jgi:tetratricopeptide (TPR) repeat protein
MVAFSRQAPAPPRPAAGDLLLRGVEFHKRGDFARAEDAYRRLCAFDPRNFQALHLIGLLMTQTGRSEAGVELIDRALAIKPDFLDALNSRGNALQSLRRFDEALASYDRALALKPRFADALINRGVVLQLLQRHEEALQAFDRALRVAPQSPEAHQNRGAALRALQRRDEAVAACDRALKLRPDYFEAAFNRGRALLELRRFAEALAGFDGALALRPSHVDALCFRGDALRALHRPEEALATYRKALALDASRTSVADICGELLLELDRCEEALALLDRALAFAPASADLLNQRGNALQRLGRGEEALAAYDGALAVAPGMAVVLHNRGNALIRLKRLDAARDCYDRGLALDPEHASTRARRGLLSLLQGDFAAGWADYEYRLRAPDGPQLAVACAAPFWRGEPIAGRSILVYDEQGLGDVLQFCRYLPLLLELGAGVAFVVRPSLAALMRMSFPAVRVLSQPPPGESFDIQCPLMSLPHAFGTTLQTIPGATPYLASDPARMGRWRERLGGGFKIGVAWRGSAQGRRFGRSFPLGALAPLGEIPGVRVISLQKPGDAEGLGDFARLETLGDDFDAGPDAFLDAAAVMQNLDLVISADTSLAHLAGALARPVWIALSDPADWRWQIADIAAALRETLGR